MPLRLSVLIIAVLAAASLAQHNPNDPPPGTPVFFETLGSYHRRIEANSPQTEAYFDQGLRFIYAFNLEEAQRSFQQGSVYDPSAPMLYWGAALALGPNINLPADPERNAAAYTASRMALAHSAGRAGPERDLAEAISKRYAPNLPTDKDAQDALARAYADAMRDLARKYPKDADIQTLFAESLMDLRPWDLWTHDGKPQPGTDEILSTLERVLAANPDHPGANHYYIHAVEASPNPEKGLAAAERLPRLIPGAGHLIHMPSHIYMRVGRYEDAAEANRRAIRTDRTYLSQLEARESPAPMFYGVYIAHNYQFLSAAAMMEGRSAESIRAARDMVAVTPEEMLRQMPDFDAIVAMPILMEARFGHWDRVLSMSEPPDGMRFPAAMRRYARGLALVAKNKPDEAQKELDALTAARDRTPAETRKLLNSARALLSVAHDVLAGQLAIARGKTDEGIELLRAGVTGEDALGYDEPPDWYAPTRHALGAALLKAGKAPDAERVYLDDLAKNPENGWALLGLAQSLKAQGKVAAAVEERLKKAWAKADVQLAASWF